MTHVILTRMSSRDHNNVTTVSFSTQAASVYSGRLSSFQHVSYSSDNAMSQTVPSQLRAAIGNNVSLWAGHYGSLWVTMGGISAASVCKDIRAKTMTTLIFLLLLLAMNI